MSGKPTDYECPHCHAPADEPCIHPNPSMNFSHLARMEEPTASRLRALGLQGDNLRVLAGEAATVLETLDALQKQGRVTIT